MNRNNIVFVPFNLKLIIAKRLNYNKTKIFYILSENKKFVFLYEEEIVINKWGNCIVLVSKEDKINQNKINKKIYDFLKSWSSFYFCKIKFKGKGFRIKFFKKIKLIKFYFGKSHKTFFYVKKLFKKKINKYKFIFYGINKTYLNKNANVINKIKKINMYTLRGLRKSRQIIFKRKGKKGTYI